MWPSRPDKFDVVVFGWGFNDWRPILDPGSALWQSVPGVASVEMRLDGWKGGGDPERRLILPLSEPNIRNCPTGWAMVPPAAALEAFADKARFANYIEQNGFGAFAPATYSDRASAVYPCVLKRTDLSSSEGVCVVRSAAELDKRLGQDPYVGHPVVLQEYIGTRSDFTTHVIAVDGIFVWHHTLEMALSADTTIRFPKPDEPVASVALSARDLFMLQRFLAPSRFTGPLNFGYRRRPSGEIAIIEINPRLGGTLFRTPARAALTDAIGVIVQHAAWHDAAH